jgi:hypothetical protein
MQKENYGISADGMNSSKYGCQNKLLSLQSGGTEAEEKRNGENKR